MARFDPEEKHAAHAFNVGSDARLSGLPLKANPYMGESVELAGCWRRGWNHTHKYYGEDVKGRWHVRSLPRVNGT